MSEGVHGWTLCKPPLGLRTPDWRMGLARRGEDDWTGWGVEGDGALRAAADFLRPADAGGGEGPARGTPEERSISEALEISRNKELALGAKAFAMARCASAEIADIFALEAEAVEAFLLLFWDVRAFLDAPGQVRVLLLKTQDEDLMAWCTLAYQHGPDVLKGLWGMVPMTEAMHEAVEEYVRSQISRHTFVAAMTAESGQGPGIGILRQFIAQKQFDKEKGAARPRAGRPGKGKDAPAAAPLRKPANMRTDALKQFAFRKSKGWMHP